MAKSSTPTDALLDRLGDTADWRVRDTRPSPSERLMCAIFGEGYRSELRDTPVVVKQGLEDEMRLVLDTCALRGPGQRRGCRVLILCFGLEDGRRWTLEEMGREFNLTRERIRQIEAKTLRQLRHPTYTRRLKPFFYPHTDLDARVLKAREELYDKLSRLYPRKVALQVVKNIKRRHLREAFRSVESALRFSCGSRISHCLNCDKPLPPGWTICDAHCRHQWRVLTLVCDGCGREFRRHQTNIFHRRPDGERRASRRTFCCRSCFRAQDGTGPPCQTCGRPMTTMPRHSAGMGRK